MNSRRYLHLTKQLRTLDARLTKGWPLKTESSDELFVSLLRKYESICDELYASGVTPEQLWKATYPTRDLPDPHHVEQQSLPMGAA